MEDKVHKLRRYGRKDYTEIVDFPVEIVGRDGAVRRYDYHSAIRLYQRRITFAPVRYDDQELVNAERNHCRSRMDQLRHSFFHRFGWGTPPHQAPAQDWFGVYSGEVAAFLKQVLGCQGRPDVRFTLLEEATGHSAWYVEAVDEKCSFFLYFYQFSEDDSEVREPFFRRLKEHELWHGGDETERLISFHHTTDCGLMLTGRAEALECIRPAKPEIRHHSGAFGRLIDLARADDLNGALSGSLKLLEKMPFERRAYSLAAMIYALQGDRSSALMQVRMGLHYFPNDAYLLFQNGVLLFEMGQSASAAALFERSKYRYTSPVLSVAGLVCIDISKNRWMTARRRCRDLPGGHDERRLRSALALLQQQLQFSAILSGLSVVVFGICFVSLILVSASMWGMVLSSIGVILSVVGLIWAFVGVRRAAGRVSRRSMSHEVIDGIRRMKRHKSSGTEVA